MSTAILANQNSCKTSWLHCDKNHRNKTLFFLFNQKKDSLEVKMIFSKAKQKRKNRQEKLSYFLPSTIDHSLKKPKTASYSKDKTIWRWGKPKLYLEAMWTWMGEESVLGHTLTRQSGCGFWESPITALPSLILVSGDIPLLVSIGVPSKGFPHIHGFYSKKRWQLWPGGSLHFLCTSCTLS